MVLKIYLVGGNENPISSGLFVEIITIGIAGMISIEQILNEFALLVFMASITMMKDTRTDRLALEPTP